MSAFFAGVACGALLVACLAVLTFTRKERRRRDIPTWTDEHYQAPPVVTNVTHHSINRIREINL